jgi:hypothetical protein
MPAYQEWIDAVVVELEKFGLSVGDCSASPLDDWYAKGSLPRSAAVMAMRRFMREQGETNVRRVG